LEEPPWRPAAVIVFVITAFAPAYALDYTLIIPRLGGASVLPLLLARMAMPTLAALAALAVSGEDPRGSWRLLGVRFDRDALRWGLTGSLLVVAAYAASLAVARALGCSLGPAGPLSDIAEYGGPLLLGLIVAAYLAAGIAAGLSVNAAAALGEEIGWRGYLYPTLAKRLGRGPAALAVGVVWGLWHAPLIAAGYNYALIPTIHNQSGAGPLGYLAAFTLYTAALGLLLAVLRDASGSVYPAAAAHGTVNALAGLFALLARGPRLVAAPAGVSVSATMALAALVASVLWGRSVETR